MNRLRYKDEFTRILQEYRISDSARQTLKKTRLVLLVGPSSSGRNTIINELLKTGNYHYIVSDTTRQPRVNNGILEQNGREYWFRDEAEMLDEIKQGQFLEAAIIHNQQVSGISIRELAEAERNRKIAINEIEVVGADNIHAVKPDALFFFVLPPSFDEWMARMSSRVQLPADEVKRRVSSAVMEISTALQRDYYHFVVNDTFMHTAREIDSLITAGGAAESEQQAAAKRIAQTLIEDTNAYLKRLKTA